MSRAIGSGWAFHPERVRATIEKAKAENALRRPCPHCSLMVLDMERHVRICHSDQ